MYAVYFVYDYGYDKAVKDLSLEALVAEQEYAREVMELQEELYDVEKAYLDLEAEKEIVYVTKYRKVKEKVDSYVESNGLGDCNIGYDGVQHVNDLLKGSSSESE